MKTKRTVELDDEQAESLAQALEKQNEVIRQHLLQYSHKIKSNESLIMNLRGGSGSGSALIHADKIEIPKSVNGSTEYDRRLTIAEKAEFLLKESGKCLTISELARAQIQHEPELTGSPLKGLSTPFAATLAKKVNGGITFNRYYDPETKQFRYGLLAWFKNGQADDRYKQKREH